MILRPPKINANVVGSEDFELCDTLVVFIIILLLLVTSMNDALHEKTEDINFYFFTTVDNSLVTF